ncbi:MAG: ABC transporter ATP-binding protein [Candidatus Bathyarchaeia archaeon]
MVKVTLENVTHYYGKEMALEDINITFEEGIPSALLGPSGCGKTTMLKIICGLLRPTKGRIYFDDEDVTDVPPEKRNVAIVFQFPVVYPLTVEKNLMFPLLNVKISLEEKRKKIREVAELMGIKHLLDRHASALGPADRQRVALARALVRDPVIFLFDEPMSSIEPEQRVILKSELKRLLSKLRKTSIFVTHDQTEAITFAEKIAVMTKGRVVQYGTYEEIYNRPATDFVAFFIGYPGMNILEAKVVDNEIIINGIRVKIPARYKVTREIGSIKFGIRPEHIQISLEEKPKWIPARVEYIEDLGNEVAIISLKIGEKTLKAKVSSLNLEKELTKVWINFPEEHINIFDINGKRLPEEVQNVNNYI